MSFADRLIRDWYAPRITLLTAALATLSPLFRAAAALRRQLYRAGVFSSDRLPVPVVVIGNITVGGSGKTPLVIALVEELVARGWHPGIVSRGYRADTRMPQAVGADAVAEMVGDEPLLLARTGRPVWIGADRPRVARALLAAHPECDVVVADDGLQHYALARDVEIAVVDVSRGLGNGLPLPAGPLREPRSRLRETDAVVLLGGAVTGAFGREFAMTFVGDRFVRVNGKGASVGAEAFRRPGVHALAGIGNPQRFFDHLRALGITASCHALPDHHRFTRADLELADATAILMTEKDAVKCTSFADDRCWALPIKAAVDPKLFALVEEKLRGSQVTRDTGVPGHQGAADL